jgi:hypothetical protein
MDACVNWDGLVHDGEFFIVMEESFVVISSKHSPDLRSFTADWCIAAQS